MERIFAIGDIHGCLDQLQRLMELVTINPERDTLVFIGDYIDRGPDSRGVVDYVLDLKERMGNTVCLLGNHEHMLRDYLTDGPCGGLYLSNGGDATFASYGISAERDDAATRIPESHLEFFRSLPTYYETEEYIFVHAGMKPGIPLEEQQNNDLLWIRYSFINSDHDFGKIVVFGHTPLMSVHVDDYKIGIDTGAVYGGVLTCLELPAMKLYQV